MPIIMIRELWRTFANFKRRATDYIKCARRRPRDLHSRISMRMRNCLREWWGAGICVSALWGVCEIAFANGQVPPHRAQHERAIPGRDARAGVCRYAFPYARPKRLNAFADSQLAGDATCIICRDEMVLGGSKVCIPCVSRVARAHWTYAYPVRAPKVLPCGHAFHFYCLRSWLERQPSCPTCRTDIELNGAAPRRAAAGVAAAAAAAAAVAEGVAGARAAADGGAPPPAGGDDGDSTRARARRRALPYAAICVAEFAAHVDMDSRMRRQRG